ncbi:MAG: hypothetical protein OWQ48_00140 [Desulfurococcus sp.]|nr:hypothetical protein [Desulfurococcus sp.]
MKKLHADILIAERGILDFLVWLTATLRWPSAIRSLPGRITLALAVSSCSKLIYVRADRNILLERRRGWRDEALIPFELVVYDTLASILKTPVVDTSRASISVSLREVLRVVGEVQ